MQVEDFKDGACHGTDSQGLSVPIGTELTFEAETAPITGLADGIPESDQQSRFAGWSRPECDTDASCTLKTAADEEWIVAQFSPVWLKVSSPKKVTVSTPQLECTLPPEPPPPPEETTTLSSACSRPALDKL